MQEDIERRSLAISVTAGKLTARTLAKAFSAVLRQIRRARNNAKAPQGRQSVKKLMNHNANTNSIPLDGETRLFDRVARKFNVDYAFRKTRPRKYLLFFKAGQADAITACFAEYTKRAMQKQRQQPIREQMRQAAKMARTMNRRERVRDREVSHDDR